MPVIGIDLTGVGLIPDGNHTVQVSEVELQAKTGEKWNKDGTLNCTFDEWIGYPEELRRIHLKLTFIELEGKVMWHDLYMIESARSFLKNFCKAAKIPFGKEGFDTDHFLGSQLGVTVAIEDDPQYGERSVITGVYAV